MDPRPCQVLPSVKVFQEKRKPRQQKPLLTPQKGEKETDISRVNLSDEIKYLNDFYLHRILRNNANLQNWHLGYEYTNPGRALTEPL